MVTFGSERESHFNRGRQLRGDKRVSDSERFACCKGGVEGLRLSAKQELVEVNELG